ncbi:MAG TPA: hypothetical protein DDW52_28245 [Planctomycetaceae bacterium]|nr:hypothetical protein [Planctomycetaceae bacterium]
MPAVIRLKILILSFKKLLARNAQDCVTILRQFDTPPTFDLWHNPVTEAADKTTTLSARSMYADDLHRASSGSLLCGDGHDLVDGGITNSMRLWLIYDYHSLPDFTGADRFTTFRVLRSARFTGDRTLALTLGYHWLPARSLSRLDFEDDDRSIDENVIASEHWRTVHTHINRF